MAEHPDDEVPELDAAERAALARWSPAPPPDDFVDRVIGVPVAASTSAPRRWRRLIGALALAVVAAAATATAWPRAIQPLAIAAASVDAGRDRPTVAIGARAVAVLEPGAQLSFLASPARARVEQRAGSVFYRVEPGRRFTVVTPAGTVEVTGTCFRVEVPSMSRRAMLMGGAIGAVVATVAVVTVYEGKVRVVSSRAAPIEVRAGEQVAVGGDGTAAIARTGGASAAALPTAPGAAAVADDPTIATLTREQLVARDRAQRAQIAALGQRVHDLEARRPGGRDGRDVDPVDPTKDELLAWAKECRVAIDLPPVSSPRAMELSPEVIKDLGLGDADVIAANAVFVRLRADWATRVRGWYIEATGDAAGADALSADAMGRELQDKAIPGEPAAVQRRLAQERAGLVAPPADLSKASPFERYFRALADHGNEAERMLGGAIGPERAHQVRRHDGGWPMRMTIAGCDDEDGARTP